jgi:hypothetical protein
MQRSLFPFAFVVALALSYATLKSEAVPAVSVSSAGLDKLVQLQDYLTSNWWKDDKCRLSGSQMYGTIRLGAAANALVTTPCLTPHVLGNRVGMYFEFFLCARSLGLNYVSVYKTDDSVNESHAFFQGFLASQ